MPDLTAWTPRVLTATERALKINLEADVDHVIDHIERAQSRLDEINRLGLWEADAPTFYEYLQKRWPQKCDRSIYRLVARVEVEQDLFPAQDESEDSPSDTACHEPSDRCIAELKRLPQSRRQEAWAIVCGRAAALGREPTPAMVQEVVGEWEQAEDAAPTTEEVRQSEEEIALEEELAADKQAWKDWHRGVKALRDASEDFRDDDKRDAAVVWLASLPEKLRRRRK